ncbi:DUF2071 domain-containing protein [soil metagenome]
MRVPVIEGVIRRRLLINFRADPEVVQRLLPAGMRPKTAAGSAIVGICLIRLEKIRPRWLPFLPGITSENAAHRFAVQFDDEDGGGEGVYVPRRDTNSALNHPAGGRLFPGEHHLSTFEIEDSAGAIDLAMRARDGSVSVRVRAREADRLPASSCFASLDESSAFFEPGKRGYSDNRRTGRLDAVDLHIEGWQVGALEVDEVRSSYFEDTGRFPEGSVEFDHALVMRDLKHEWSAGPDR